MLKQLEVLKEEEKEFQNLKVSWILGPASVLSEEMGSEPPRSLLAEGLHPGVLGTPPRAHHGAEPAHASLLLPGCVSLGRVPSAGLSQRAVPVQGERLRHAGTVCCPQQLLGTTQRCGARTLVCKGHLCPSLEGAEQIEIHWWHKRTLLEGLVVEVSSKGGL